MPAFIDAHSHFLQTAQNIDMCDLSEAEDFDTHEYQKSIREMNNSMYRELFEAYEMKYDINKPKKAKKVSEKVNKK